MGSNELIVGNHNRQWTSLDSQSEAINSAYFNLYRATESTSGPIATIVGNILPADITQSNTLAEGLYRAWFQGRNSYLKKGQDDLALLIVNQDGTIAVPTTSYSPRVTATGIFLHKGNNYQQSLFDSRGNAYSEGCQTTGCYSGSLQNHNAFFQKVGRNFNGKLLSKSSTCITATSKLYRILDMKIFLNLIVLNLLFACSPTTDKKDVDGEVVNVDTLEDNNTVETVSLSQPIPSLAGTKWEYVIAENCINSYFFKVDSTYEFYSCEMEDTFAGAYFIEGDTLILIEDNLKDVYSNDGSVSQEKEKIRFKGIFEENHLALVSREKQVGDDWIDLQAPNIDQYKYSQNQGK